jgi:hypothetical protein
MEWRLFPARRVGTGVAVLLVLAAHAPTAGAVAQRTFVGSYGNDANLGLNCALATPCRSFAAAITATAANGEVVVLDSAGYGPVTVMQGVSITSPPGVYAGISVPAGSNGVTINAPGAIVYLRGLRINGQGGLRGIRVDLAAKVRIEDCAVTNMGSDGISVYAAVDLALARVSVADNAGTGIYVSKATKGALDDVRIESSGGYGLVLEGGPRMSARNLTVAANGASGIYVLDADSSPANALTTLAVTGASVHGNLQNGVSVLATNGTQAELVMRGAAVTGNGLRGVRVEGGSSGKPSIVLTETTVSRNASDGVLLTMGGGSNGRAVLTRSEIQHNGNYGLLATTPDGILTLQATSSTLGFSTADELRLEPARTGAMGFMSAVLRDNTFLGGVYALTASASEGAYLYAAGNTAASFNCYGAGTQCSLEGNHAYLYKDVASVVYSRNNVTFNSTPPSPAPTLAAAY